MLNPTIYAVELRNRTFDLVNVLTKKVKNLSWYYQRVSGCGSCTIDLSMAPEDLADINADYDVQVWVEGELRYRGYIETFRPVISKPDTIQLQMTGYSGQLKRVHVDHTYTDMEVSEIVKDILDNYVLPQTSITYNAADIEATSFTVDTLTFDTMADSAIKTLVELAGAFEWGVDRNKNFFFKKQSDVVKHHLRLGKDISKYDTSNEYGNIKNKIVLKGGTVDDAQYTETVNNEESQGIYGIRTKIISNSSITTATVAQRYCTSYLAGNAIPQREIAIMIPKSAKFFEETLPVGRVDILGGTMVLPKKYGDSDAIYGQFFKYGGTPSYQVSKVRHKVANSGLDITLYAGTARPNIATDIERLEYEIEQLQNT